MTDHYRPSRSESDSVRGYPRARMFGESASRAVERCSPCDDGRCRVRRSTRRERHRPRLRRKGGVSPTPPPTASATPAPTCDSGVRCRKSSFPRLQRQRDHGWNRRDENGPSAASKLSPRRTRRRLQIPVLQALTNQEQRSTRLMASILPVCGRTGRTCRPADTQDSKRNAGFALAITDAASRRS